MNIFLKTICVAGLMLSFAPVLGAQPIEKAGRQTTLDEMNAAGLEMRLNAALSGLQNPATRVGAFCELMAIRSPDIYPDDARDDTPEIKGIRTRAWRALRDRPEITQIVEETIAAVQTADDKLPILLALIEAAGTRLYWSGSISYINPDRIWDKIEKRATFALGTVFNPQLASPALDSPDNRLQFWALWNFGSGTQKYVSQAEARKPNTVIVHNVPEGAVLVEDTAIKTAWLELQPKVRKLAAQGSSHIRWIAVDRVDDEEFLERRLDEETSASVLMKLARRGGKEYENRYLPRLLRLLQNADEKIRYFALLRVGSSSSDNPIWKVTFNQEIYNRVVELTKSPSDNERSTAAGSLERIGALDLDKTREIFLRLVQDPSPEVRWRVAWGLKDQLDHQQVLPVLQKLLNDPSSLVRYMTIVKLGSERFIPELKILANDPDEKVAEMAQWRSKGLEQGGKLPEESAQ